MDVTYNQHSNHARRNNRSSLNLNHLSLAPLTSRLPLKDADELPEPVFHPRPSHGRSISYLEGKSAPTTPGILSRSSSRVSLRKPVFDGLTKSKSSSNVASTQLTPSKSPLSIRGRRGLGKDDPSLSSLTVTDRNDSDWLLRAGALISSETRELKGQSWLVSRASSTSLTGQLDEDEEALERQLARERESRLNSRRGSAADADDEFSPLTTRMSCGGGSRSASRYGSCANSRAQSRIGSKANLSIPVAMREKEKESYIGGEEEEFGAEPDFVDIDEEVYEGDQEEDEALVKTLAKKGSLGLGLWVEKLMGWSLFAVEEDGEETDVDTNEEKTETDTSDAAPKKKRSFQGTLDGAADATDEKLPPLRPDEGGWQDAAWLLSVASKVLL
jgi:Protein of unknown function (DUF3984)